MDNSGLPPSGWYPDPENPGQLRFWDGEMWTSHRSPDNGGMQPAGFGGPTGSGLTPLGEWFSKSFRVAWERVQNSLVITLLLGIPAQIAVMFCALWFIRPFELSRNCDFTGFQADRMVVFIVVVLLGVVAQAVGLLAVSRQMQLGHQGLDESWTASLAHGVRRFGRLALAFLLIVLVVGAAMVAFGFLVAAGAGGVIAAVLLFIVLIPVMLWASVWLSFLPMAATAAPGGTPLLRTCREITSGRWWAIFGRLILLGLALMVANTVVSATTSALLPSNGVATVFDIDEFDPENDDCPVIDMDLEMPDTAPLLISLLISSVFQGLLGLPMISGIASLYLQAGAPLETRPERDDAAQQPGSPYGSGPRLQ